MDVAEAVIMYANQHLGQYRMRGDELIPKYCPVCGGGGADQYTFSINTETGLANCKRGSCGFHGTINQLLSMAGDTNRVDMKGRHGLMKAKKNYVLPNAEDVLPLTEEGRAYLHTRKLNDATIDLMRIGSDAKGNIVFPFYRDGSLVFVKYRHPHKFRKGQDGQKEWQMTGTEPILYNMDNVRLDQPIYIVEGELDCVAMVQAGVTNTVSVASGCDNLECITNCWDWLDQAHSFVFLGDADDCGQKMVDNLVRRFGEARCSVVDPSNYGTTPEGRRLKDANEILFYRGEVGLLEVAAQAEPMEIPGLIDLADVNTDFDESDVCIPYGVPGLDEATGGMAEGGITIMTGDQASGKSTITGQILLNAIEHGYNVCAYSGELSRKRFRRWIDGQAAGDEYMGLTYDPVRQKDVPVAIREARARIDDYLRGHFLLYDNKMDRGNEKELDLVFRLFEAAVRRYNAKIFLIDNMMSITLLDSSEQLEAEGKFLGAVNRFAKRWGVHIILVAHLRKRGVGQANVSVGAQDIQGSSTSYKAADTIILVKNQTLKILKNRDDGVLTTTPFVYCPASRRIYQQGYEDAFTVSWDQSGVPEPNPRADSLTWYQPKMPPISMDDPF